MSAMLELPDRAALRPALPGLALAVLTLLFGFGLGGVFGLDEDAIKSRLSASAAAVQASVYQGDHATAQAVVAKSWTYMQRAHLHAGSLGTAAVVLTILVVLLGASPGVTRAISIGLGAGALGYSVFWMWAGFLATFTREYRCGQGGAPVVGRAVVRGDPGGHLRRRRPLRPPPHPPTAASGGVTRRAVQPSSPRCCAWVTASRRVRVRSFWLMWCRWLRSVCGEMSNWRAMAVELRPAAKSLRIRHSCSDSGLTGAWCWRVVHQRE